VKCELAVDASTERMSPGSDSDLIGFMHSLTRNLGGHVEC